MTAENVLEINWGNAPSCRLSLTKTQVVTNTKIDDHSFEIIRDKMMTVVQPNMLCFVRPRVNNDQLHTFKM